jgi:hypothetical protein
LNQRQPNQPGERRRPAKRLQHDFSFHYNWIKGWAGN